MSLRVCSLLLFACGLIACQKPVGQAVRPTSAIHLMTEVRQPVFTLPECIDGACPQASIQHVVTNLPWLNRFLDQKIFDHYAADFIDMQGKPVHMVPASFQDVIDQHVLFEGAEDDDSPITGYHQIEASTALTGVKGNLGIFYFYWSFYPGSHPPHGISGIEYYVLDLRHQRQLALKDIIIPGQTAALDQLLIQQYMQWVQQHMDTDTAAYYKKEHPFQVTENYFFNNRGLAFQYQEYELGSYVLGAPVLTIPYPALKGVLKPEYLDNE